MIQTHVATGILFGLFGIICLAWFFHQVFFGFKNMGWPQTTGKILSNTTILRLRYWYGRSWLWTINYTYAINEKPYESSRLACGVPINDTAFLPDKVRSFLKSLKLGDSITVFYNPKKPRCSVLYRGLSYGKPWLTIVFIGGIFSLFLSFLDLAR